jgi:glycerate 2-kinase
VRVVIALDSFKGTVAAIDAVRHIASGWRQVRPQDDLMLLPLADGGEGTLDVLASAVPAATTHAVPSCTGPDGRRVDGRFLLLPDGSAAVELAGTSGLPLMRVPDPLRATSRGLGEVIGAALDAAAHKLVVAVGGSASTDGGTGALRALGLELYDECGQPLDDGGGALAKLARIDQRGLRAPPPGGVEILSDVRHRLLGSDGAAAMFGPQKGADADAVATLDAALTRFAQLSGGDPAAAGTGAAGGTAFGFATLWGATIVGGASVVADLAGLDDALAGADLVITGEGRLDASSRRGKVVGEVASRAALVGKHGVPVVVVCGANEIVAWPPIVDVVSLTDLASSAHSARRRAAFWLRVAGEHVASRLQRSTYSTKS